MSEAKDQAQKGQKEKPKKETRQKDDVQVVRTCRLFQTRGPKTPAEIVPTLTRLISDSAKGGDQKGVEELVRLAIAIGDWQRAGMISMFRLGGEADREGFTPFVSQDARTTELFRLHIYDPEPESEGSS